MRERLAEKNFDAHEILAIIRRNGFGIVISLIFALEITALLLIYLPRKFKAETVVDIQSSYFRNPLVSDLVSETTDPSELKAQRAGLIQLALNPSFIDQLGEKHGLFKSEQGSRERRIEQEGLLKRIEYFSLGPTSFQLSTVASEAAKAKALAADVLRQVTETVVEARYEALQQAHTAIQSQVEFLARTLKDLGRLQQANQLQDRLGELDSRIAALRAQFTDSHPNVVELRKEAGALRNRLGRNPLEPSIFEESQNARAFSHSESEEPIQEIYHDLLQKLSHLNIVLTMEAQSGKDTPMYLAVLEEPTEPTSAFFPKADRFLLFGLAGGVLLATLQAVFFELRRAEQIIPEDVTHGLQIPHLGRLPALPSRKELLMLENKMARFALPAPGEDST